jgi:hypothetical protein
MGIVTIPCRAQEPYAIEPTACKASAYLPQSVVDALNPDGVRLFTYSNGLKMPIMEIFWSKTVKAQSSTTSPGALLYGNLTPGTMVGVVHFLAEANEDYREDFRDQKLKPGYYTMRYGVQPEDPEQKQSTARDFLLLSPVSVDRDPAKTPGVEDLTHSSRMASHAKFPAVLSLVPVTPGQKEPGVRTDDTGTCVLQFRVKLESDKDPSAKEQAMALIVVTPIKDNSGS